MDLMNIFDFFELVEYDSREFESAYTTLGGWCTEMLEDFPEVGEKFSFENMDFEILEMDDLRVEKVKVTINAKTDQQYNLLEINIYTNNKKEKK